MSFQGGVADLLLGLPSRYQQDSNTVFNLFQKIYSLYAQDDWKISTRLTLNYGLRYEFSTPPRERDFQWANFDPSTRAYILAKEGSLFSESLIHPDYNNFAPRFGFAYAPHHAQWCGVPMGFSTTTRTARAGKACWDLISLSSSCATSRLQAAEL